jgi:MbtH protein
MSDNTDNGVLYSVVMNGEEQYSIWPADRPIPAGWTTAGPTASKSACLDYIKEVWTDMRPLSLRKALDARREPRPEE